MDTTQLKRVRRLFNTGIPQLDRYNHREWVRAVRTVRTTKKGWVVDNHCTPVETKEIQPFEARLKNHLRQMRNIIKQAT